ncbi:MAG: acyl carrier protein phosphodiesterase [Marinilabiliales bacterium]|nr:acyl carrier protein phosphodiesterase [Marinilabiliales bacterium]
MPSPTGIRWCTAARLHFTGRYRKYAGVIIDILYDHYLTREWDLFSRRPLESVTYNFYRAMVNNFEILPENVREKMPFFIIDNWLETYQTTSAASRGCLRPSATVTSLPKETRWAMRTLEETVLFH